MPFTMVPPGPPLVAQTCVAGQDYHADERRASVPEAAPPAEEWARPAEGRAKRDVYAPLSAGIPATEGPDPGWGRR